MTIDERWMHRALLLAQRGKHTHPNPKVGAIVVKDSVIVGEGWHVRPGMPHAETMAFAAAGDRARGATIYVTLEPCAHTMRPDGTPRLPCAQRCIDAGIARLVCTMQDPDVRVAGQGFERLRAVGIEVVVGVGEPQSRAMNRPYIKHRTTGLPWILHKSAMSLDGKIATVTGSSQWITGPASRSYVHRSLRNVLDAVVVGSGTVIADNPSLTTRITGRGNVHQPLRVILDSRLRIPVTSKVCGPGTVIVTVEDVASEIRAKAFVETGAEVVGVRAGADGRIDPTSAMRYLANERGALHVLLESGGELAAAFYAARLVDEALFIVAPKLIGGGVSPTPIDGAGLTKAIEGAVHLGTLHTRRLGTDLAIQTDIVYDNDREARKA